MKKRRKFTADFKSKVAVEALREQQAIHEIAKRYQVHASQVTEWWLVSDIVDAFAKTLHLYRFQKALIFSIFCAGGTLDLIQASDDTVFSFEVTCVVF